jgi:hypothetical protein
MHVRTMYKQGYRHISNEDIRSQHIVSLDESVYVRHVGGVNFDLLEACPIKMARALTVNSQVS